MRLWTPVVKFYCPYLWFTLMCHIQLTRILLNWNAYANVVMFVHFIFALLLYRPYLCCSVRTDNSFYELLSAWLTTNRFRLLTFVDTNDKKNCNKLLLINHFNEIRRKCKHFCKYCHSIENKSLRFWKIWITWVEIFYSKIFHH